MPAKARSVYLVTVKVAAVLCSFVLLFVLAFNARAQTNSKTDWEKLVKAAREEGRLTIYGTTIFEDVFRDFFQKAYPEIKLSFAVGRGAEIAPRLMQERRAGIYQKALRRYGRDHKPRRRADDRLGGEGKIRTKFLRASRRIRRR